MALSKRNNGTATAVYVAAMLPPISNAFSSSEPCNSAPPAGAFTSQSCSVKSIRDGMEELPGSSRHELFNRDRCLGGDPSFTAGFFPTGLPVSSQRVDKTEKLHLNRKLMWIWIVKSVFNNGKVIFDKEPSIIKRFLTLLGQRP